MIQIDFYDKDIVSTLLPISTMRPDRVIFLIDKRNITGREPENVLNAIKGIVPDAEVEFEPVAVDDLSEIYGKIKDIVKDIDTSDACIDLTGGSELMSACGYRAAMEFDILPIYVDVRREYVINAESGEIIRPVRHISIEDCLTAIGAKRLKDSHDLPTEEEYDGILAMSQIIFSNVDAWQDLCQHIANTVASTGHGMKVRLPEKFGKYQKAIEKLIEGFEAEGFWVRTESPREYKFTSTKARNYMTTFGTWLELFVYINALKVFDEAVLGVVVDWYDADNVDTQDNEIDVVAMRRSIPIFISCKMRKPVSGDLYEIGFVASRLGGSKAKAVLATTYPVKELGTSPKRMYQRMKKFRVGLIEAENFDKLPAADVFNQAIQMTE